MKKFITLLLVLTGMVSTVMATKVITIYFQPNSDWASSSASFKLIGYAGSGASGATSTQSFVKYNDFGNKIYSATMDIDAYPYIKFKRCNSDGTADWNLSHDEYTPSTNTYYYMTGSDYGDWNYYPSTASSYLPNKYYLMSDATGSWKAVGEMTEATGVYSYTLAASTYANKQFAIAKGYAFTEAGAFENGTDYANWLNAIRPVAGSTKYQINFANYSGTTETNRKDGSAALWYVASGNNSGDITLNFTPGATPNPTFSVSCEHSVDITSAGYATYSNAYDYKVVGATAYTVTVSGDIATLNSLGTSANIPGGTGIIISGSTNTYTVTPKDGDYADVSGNLLIGSNNYTYDITGTYPLDAGSYTAYIFADGADGVGFYKLASGESNKTIAAHKAFLAVPGTSARDFFGFDNDETGINEVANNATIFNSPIYNLQGVRLSKFQKGLNIVNGKKVLVK